MEEKKVRYKRGQNPNSRANLKPGGFATDRELQKKATENARIANKAAKTQKEITNEILCEEEEYIIKGVAKMLSKHEVCVRNFVTDCMKHPTPQKMAELRKMTGEDEQNINLSVQPMYSETTLPPDIAEKVASHLLSVENEKGI